VDGLTRWVAEQGAPFWQKLCETVQETKFWSFWQSFWDRTRGDKQQRERHCLPIGRKEYKEKPANSFVSRLKRATGILPRAKSEDRQDTNENDKGDAEIESTMVTYTMSRMLQFTSLVATLIACLLPIVAITVLSKMHTQPKILGFMALFTALFAMGLMWLTNPGTSRTEIFTATAAFSAVLVVFVQNQNGNTNGS